MSLPRGALERPQGRSPLSDDIVFLAVVDEVDDRRGDVRCGRLVLDDVGRGAETVTDGEAVPIRRHMRVDGEAIAFLVEAQDVLDAGLVSP